MDIINSDHARQLYFNHYVEMENLLREVLSFLMGIKISENILFNDIIKGIKKTKTKVLPISIAKMDQHKKVRNWLAHKRNNVFPSEKQLVLMSFANTDNITIKTWLIKK